jgi:hypothetical protein
MRVLGGDQEKEDGRGFVVGLAEGWRKPCLLL